VKLVLHEFSQRRGIEPPGFEGREAMPRIDLPWPVGDAARGARGRDERAERGERQE
jgi:hypothetical protein